MRWHGISIHAPRAGRDPPFPLSRSAAHISIHAPRAGRDYPSRIGIRRTGYAHFNPRAPCGARRVVIAAPHHRPVISIHAPHAGRDVILNPIPQEVALFQSTRPMRGATISLTLRRSAALYFNPRAPCGRDGLYGYSRYLLPEFQSTRPVRARRGPPARPTAAYLFQSTRPVRARLSGSEQAVYHPQFQSTRPVRARLLGTTQQYYGQYISIHAPRAGATL